MTDQELSHFNRQIAQLRHLYRNVCMRPETADTRHDKGLLDLVIKNLEQLYASDAAKMETFWEWSDEHLR
jgi:hypothetical protein